MLPLQFLPVTPPPDIHLVLRFEGLEIRKFVSDLREHASPVKGGWGTRGTSLIRNNVPLVPYSRTLPRASWWS